MPIVYGSLPAQGVPVTVEWLNHTGIIVSDMERSLAFYRDVLGLTEERNDVLEGEMISQVAGFENTRLHIAYLGIGDMRHSIELVQYLNPKADPVDLPPRNAVGERPSRRHRE